MSSTNRGYDRHKSDYYITPIKPIKEFLSEFLLLEKIDRPDSLFWLDPCAGGDKNNEMPYPKVIREEFDADVATIDIRRDSKAFFKKDYLGMYGIHPAQDIIITNPPFYLAINIIQKALCDVKEDGYVIMLLRLNFWGSKERNQWLKDNMPKYCFIHGFPRMSFTKDGGTDSIEYAHFVWQKGYKTNQTKTILL